MTTSVFVIQCVGALLPGFDARVRAHGMAVNAQRRDLTGTC